MGNYRQVLRSFPNLALRLPCLLTSRYSNLAKISQHTHFTRGSRRFKVLLDWIEIDKHEQLIVVVIVHIWDPLEFAKCWPVTDLKKKDEKESQTGPP